jgi:hypothetical protein
MIASKLIPSRIMGMEKSGISPNVAEEISPYINPWNLFIINKMGLQI